MEQMQTEGQDFSYVHTTGISSQMFKHSEDGRNSEYWLIAFIDNDLLDEYSKFLDCSSRVIPFKCLNPQCGRSFFSPFRCDLRICPKCNERYAKLFKARYLPLIKNLMRGRGKDRLALLTLTTKNTGEIPDTEEFKRHNKSVGKLIKKFFKGGVAVNEVKGTFLHTHAVVFGPYVPKKILSEYWHGLTGNQVVWITQVKKEKGGPKKVASYLCKYIRKPYPITEEWESVSLAVKLLSNLKGVRRVHNYGCFYNNKTKGEDTIKAVCPFCGESWKGNIVIDSDKHKLGWYVKEARICGIPSYYEALNLIDVGWIRQSWQTEMN